MKQLTYAEIVDATGVINVDELENIEILFTTCEAIGSMDRCARLKRLSMIDNGLKVISGLEPVRMTLMSLCLCDQEIVNIGKLDLPCLRELFLHRNRIVEMSGLGKCPRLTKLWLFQNSIKAISDLNCLTELEECWLQANRIKKLDGLEYNNSLIYLGIAGNPITEHSEFMKLKSLSNLQELSLNDIHFGKCDVVLDGAAAGHGGYKDFIMCHLPQVHLLDGISLTRANQRQAEINYDFQVRQFNAQLSEIEESYRREIQAIDMKRQSSVTHSKSLEKDISSSLKDLEDIVRGGRKAVDGEIVRQKALLDENFAAFDANISKIYKKTSGVVEQAIIPELNQEYDLIEALFHITERLAVAESRMVDCFVDAYEQRAKKGASGSFAFSALSENTLDFQYMSNVLNASRYRNSSAGDGGGQEAGAASDYCLSNSLVLMKLYRICFVPEPSPPPLSDSTVRVFAALTPAMLSVVLKSGWEKASPSSGAMFWCSDPEVAVGMFLNTPYTKAFCTDDSAPAESDTSAADESKSPRRQNTGLDESVFPSWSVLDEAKKAKVVMLLCCQLDVAKACVSRRAGSGPGDAVTALPIDASKRVAVLNDIRKTKSSVSLEVVMETPSGTSGPAATLYVVPCSECSSLIHVEFAAACVTPMTTLLQLGHSNASLAGASLMLDSSQHGLKPLEQKLEMLLLACGNSSKGDQHKVPSIPELLVQFENEVNYECLKYQEDLLEDLQSEQGEQLRNIDYQLYAKENDTKKVRGEIDRERKTQDMLLRDLRQQLQQQNEEVQSQANSRAVGVRASQSMRSSKNK